MSVEPFLYLLLFLFIALLSFVVRWLRGEIEKSAAMEGESKAFGLFQESPAPLMPAVERHQPSERRIRKVSSLAPARPVGKVRKMKIHPRNLQEMRRGIVLMTLLGPCRALEPPNESLRL